MSRKCEQISAIVTSSDYRHDDEINLQGGR